MGLLDEIRDGAVDSNVPLAALLWNSLVLAARLGHQDFKDWVQHELSDYPENVSLPPYVTTSRVI